MEQLENLLVRVQFRIFLKKARDYSRITGKFRTVYPPKKPSKSQWMNEFNVSMLHNRVIVHMD